MPTLAIRYLTKFFPTLLLLAVACQPSIEQTSSDAPAKILGDVWSPLSQPWVGDLNDMIQRQEIRVLTSLTLGQFFIDRGQQKGSVYEGVRLLEKFLKKRLGRKSRFLRVIIVPVRRDKLLDYLVQGYGDIAFANLTVTPKRLKVVDFSAPYFDKAKELLVTGPKSPPVANLGDLSGKKVFVRADSSYFESLETLNLQFRKKGKREVQIVPADPRLQDNDILEMLNVGLCPMTVVDGHKLQLWSRVFKNVRVREDIALREKGQIALAIREKSPQLKAAVDAFVKQHKVGTLMGNIIVQRYLENIQWVRPALQQKPFRQFEKATSLFQTYGKRYDFDWLMLASFAYQESGFDQNARSYRGAVGIMQVLPSTATSIGIRRIEQLENNIHAGSKYLSILRDKYFSAASIDPFERMLFTMAGYNAGPNRINGLRKAAAERGLNPEKWFQNVEHVVAAAVGREPVRYVSNIYKYYVAYKRTLSELRNTKGARKNVSPPH